VSPCCGETFPCRLCHDAVHEEGCRDVARAHRIDRHAVTRVRCSACGAEQAKAARCASAACGIAFAAYFCDICSFYTDRSKEPFHCAGCGICRVGGAANFFHCARCNACFPHAIRDSHTCTADALKSNCPICMEDMHSSRDAAVLQRCGHAMHQRCLAEYGRTNYRCPSCAASLTDMAAAWRERDAELAETRMPADLSGWTVRVHCVDCRRESVTAWWPMAGTAKCRAIGPPPDGTAAAKDAADRKARHAAVVAAAAARAAAAAAPAQAQAQAAPPPAAAAGAAVAPEVAAAGDAPEAAAAEPPAAAYKDWLCGSYNTQPVGERARATPELEAVTAAFFAHVLAQRDNAFARAAALMGAGDGDGEGSDGDGEEDGDDDDDDDDDEGDGDEEEDEEDEEEEEEEEEGGTGEGGGGGGVGAGGGAAERGGVGPR
jgi:RING finger/CHY zinc finger protein 1